MKFLIVFLLLFAVSCSESVKTENDDVVADDVASDTGVADEVVKDEDSETADEDQVSICEVLEAAVSQHIDTAGVSNKAIGVIIRLESPDVSQTCTFGSKVKGEEVRPTGNEQWVIGSVSKMITSHLIARKAVDIDGLLDESAKKYLPEDWAIPTGSGGENFSLTHLLTHTSGLPHYPKTLQESIDNVSSLDDMYSAWEDYTIEDLESDLSETTLSFDPGTAYLYSDFGFALVQQVIENIDEKSFPEILEDFSELMGLKNTIVPENLSEEQKNDLFYGHGGGLVVAMPDPVIIPVFTGDGFIYSDADDMGRLLRIFAGIDDAPDENVTGTLKLMEEERFPRDADGTSIAQGLGIGVITEGDFKIYKKNGTSAGTTTAFLWDKNNKLGVVVAGNIIPFGEGVNSIVCEVYRILAQRSDVVVPDDVIESCQIAF